MIIGTLVYNEIVVIHYFGFDTNTKSNIKRQAMLQEAEIAASPPSDNLVDQ